MRLALALAERGRGRTRPNPIVGAVGVHVRTRVLHNLAFPLGYLALAVGAFAVAAGR